MSRYSRCFSVVFIATGLILILSSIIIFAYDFVNYRKTDKNLPEITEKIERLLPNKREAFVSKRSDYTMPSVEIDGYDFVGLIEVQNYSVKLPIYSIYDSVHMPAVYSGSAYDGSLVICGKYADGQFNFADKLEVGEQLTFTDLYGQIFRYTVKRITHSDSLSEEKLQTDNDDLTLFVKLNGSYIIIHCSQ